jgi:hypothetical protein
LIGHDEVNVLSALDRSRHFDPGIQELLMSANSAATPKWMYWLGWVLSILPSAMLILSAVMKITLNPQAVEGFKKAGWDGAILRPLGIVELLCTILYLNPQTSVLGAILLTGYMGGAISHHLSQQESILIQVAFGVVIWLGIFLRERRLWALIPWRTPAATA